MNIKSVDALPEGYQLDREINLEKDKRLFWMINILSIVLFIPFVLIAIVLQISFTIEIIPVMMIFPLSIGAIIIHELIHGFFFKRGTKQKVKFAFHGWAASASVPGVYFYKHHYLKVGLSPAIILNGLLIFLLLVLPNAWFYPLYITLAIHFGGCIGDFYVSLLLRKYDASTLIEDTGVGMKFYTKTKC
ncbi:MAG TPA: DUF3267 domain-containing protein [Bacilli bacterium]|nr:DUF3267 domain-containing protein [Bacilli bacterium]